MPVPELSGQTLKNPRKLALYGALFVLCLLTVFRVLPYGILTVIVVAALALVEPSLLPKLDFGLLATFVCFFMFPATWAVCRRCTICSSRCWSAAPC
mgnify:CR=1 FL=1